MPDERSFGFTCPCGARHELPTEFAGTEVTCGACGKVVTAEQVDEPVILSYGPPRNRKKVPRRYWWGAALLWAIAVGVCDVLQFSVFPCGADRTKHPDTYRLSLIVGAGTLGALFGYPLLVAYNIFSGAGTANKVVSIVLLTFLAVVVTVVCGIVCLGLHMCP